MTVGEKRRADPWNDLVARRSRREILKRALVWKNFIPARDSSLNIAMICRRRETHTYAHTYISRLVSSVRCLQNLIEPSSKSRSSPIVYCDTQGALYERVKSLSSIKGNR